MVRRKERKSKYFRGSRTHGWGRVAQHRRSGRKGGRGFVGYHKHKWSWTVKYAPDLYGSYGFKRHPSIVVQYATINVGVLDERLEKLVEAGLASKSGDKYFVDLSKLGINKLTGSGRISKKVVVTVAKATDKALQKIKEAGGDVLIPGDEN
ncbi:MAG: uL15m family ribosomal protein [Infirmifilum sp.]|uniref:Large ribosomal subunit protein uL15 n=1 Tax=Infirmifilum uzonense TaxID=1550241 RepID=A0A0F7FIL0_9CREN|nr:uL15 family ribosomal protein [Infirmifilum uzonense]AKG39258.1 50S ribosomal protein L15 [Infirmifilum uzonense]